MEECESCGDYYYSSQVKGEIPNPTFTAASFTADLSLARKLRGSEAERQAAITAYQRLVSELGNEAPETKAVAEILVAEAQDYAAATVKAREAEALIGAKARGEVLVDFSVYHRRGGMSGCGDAWVIRSDGSQRDPDVRDVPRHKCDGTYTWRLVAAEELALLWSLDSGHDVAGTSDCKVAKLPVGGCTPDQLRAVGAIETELGVAPGAFGLDPLLSRELAAKLEVVKQTYNRLPKILQRSDGWRDEWTFPEISGNNGVHLAQGYGDRDFTSLVNDKVKRG